MRGYSRTPSERSAAPDGERETEEEGRPSREAERDAAGPADDEATSHATATL
jgi:hypothetical protein